MAGLDLVADCSRCFGLCCVVPAFAKSADFAVDKPAGTPCRHLVSFACGIHTSLRQQGFSGCTVYDCFGAGQHVAQGTYDGRDWRSAPDVAAEMFAVFPVMRQLHELLRYVSEALTFAAAATVHAELQNAWDDTVGMTEGSPAEIMAVDVATHRDRVNALLLRASELVRAQVSRRTKDFRGSDLAGARLASADLRAASLRGAVLIGADLIGADLRSADLIGSDLRGADLRGADLRGALFLVQSQLDAARGDARTQVSDPLVHPSHWPGS
ncbi:pentapeptide repeat-containing protein [Acidothermaceae bacterium B102]|nr:pentapeptide repeat-containing protein [Acidothermaceae bacterium B102]